MRIAVALVVLAGCKPFEPDFTVLAGVETATVVGVQPGDPMTLLDADGNELLTILADDHGQANFAYVPETPVTLDSREGVRFPVLHGHVLDPGEYEIRNGDLRSGPFHVLAVDEVPDESLYDQALTGVHYSPLSGDLEDPLGGFQYITTRDGVTLSVMVRFPDPTFYGEGPWPTVIEYSGYSPSRPDRIPSGAQIANALGYATVGVNMRGTGCSGGVFDLFNRAQHADGYDVVEAVARQDWVLGHQVGMVGVSYPGISQLFVASTNPPSLAAIAPSSTIADPWEMQWPGGIYNVGFTKTWVGERESEAASGGASWVDDRIAAGDDTCAANSELSAQNIEFESFLHALEFRPPDADDRDLNDLVRQIEAPVFLLGGFEDEQTGVLYGSMLDHFDASPKSKFLLYNGRHPDGFAPDAVYRWWEFLELYVAERIPKLNAAIRAVGAGEFASQFEMDGYAFPDDRFSAYTAYDDALAAYEAETPVRVLLEVGAADGRQAGEPIARFEASYPSWPPPEAEARAWYAGDGTLDADPGPEGADTWRFDAAAGTTNFFGPNGYQLMARLWDLDWTSFAPGDMASYATAPFEKSAVIAGPGVASLWVRSPVDDADVQVTITEVRPDGAEVFVESGWLRLGHRKGTVEGRRIARTYAEEDFQPLVPGEWVQADVQIPSFAHPVRAGSRLRMVVSSPGRDHGTWQFESPTYSETPVFELGRGGSHATRLELSELPGIAVPDGLPPCPSLRGQPCRAYAEVPNVPAD